MSFYSSASDLADLPSSSDDNASIGDMSAYSFLSDRDDVRSLLMDKDREIAKRDGLLVKAKEVINQLQRASTMSRSPGSEPAQLHATIEDLRSQNRVAQVSLHALQREIEQLQTECDAKQTQLTAQSVELRDKDELLSESVQTITALEAQADAARSAVQRRETQLARLFASSNAAVKSFRSVLAWASVLPSSHHPSDETLLPTATRLTDELLECLRLIESDVPDPLPLLRSNTLSEKSFLMQSDGAVSSAPQTANSMILKQTVEKQKMEIGHLVQANEALARRLKFIEESERKGSLASLSSAFSASSSSIHGLNSSRSGTPAKEDQQQQQRPRTPASSGRLSSSFAAAVNASSTKSPGLSATFNPFATGIYEPSASILQQPNGSTPMGLAASAGDREMDAARRVRVHYFEEMTKNRDQAMTGLMEINSNVEAQNQHLQNITEEQERRLAELEAALDAVTSERDQLAPRAERTEEELRATETKLADVERRASHTIHALEQEISSLRTNLHTQEGAVQALRQELEQREARQSASLAAQLDKFSSATASVLKQQHQQSMPRSPHPAPHPAPVQQQQPPYKSILSAEDLSRCPPTFRALLSFLQSTPDTSFSRPTILSFVESLVISNYTSSSSSSSSITSERQAQQQQELLQQQQQQQRQQPISSTEFSEFKKRRDAFDNVLLSKLHKRIFEINKALGLSHSRGYGNGVDAKSKPNSFEKSPRITVLISQAMHMLKGVVKRCARELEKKRSSQSSTSTSIRSGRSRSRAASASAADRNSDPIATKKRSSSKQAAPRSSSASGSRKSSSSSAAAAKASASASSSFIPSAAELMGLNMNVSGNSIVDTAFSEAVDILGDEFMNDAQRQLAASSALSSSVSASASVDPAQQRASSILAYEPYIQQLSSSQRTTLLLEACSSLQAPPLALASAARRAGVLSIVVRRLLDIVRATCHSVGLQAKECDRLAEAVTSADSRLFLLEGALRNIYSELGVEIPASSKDVDGDKLASVIASAFRQHAELRQRIAEAAGMAWPPMAIDHREFSVEEEDEVLVRRVRSLVTARGEDVAEFRALLELVADVKSQLGVMTTDEVLPTLSSLQKQQQRYLEVFPKFQSLVQELSSTLNYSSIPAVLRSLSEVLNGNGYSS